MLPSYRNLSIDLQNKSIVWFLYEGTIERQLVIVMQGQLQGILQNSTQELRLKTFMLG